MGQYLPRIINFNYDSENLKYSIIIRWKDNDIIVNNTVDKNFGWFRDEPCIGFEMSFQQSKYFIIIYNKKLSEKLKRIYRDITNSAALTQGIEKNNEEFGLRKSGPKYYLYSELSIQYNDSRLFFCRIQDDIGPIEFNDNGDGSYSPYDFSYIQHYFPSYRNSYLNDILMIDLSIPDKRNTLVDANVCKYYFYLKKLNSAVNIPFIINAYEKEININVISNSYIILYNKLYIDNNLYVFYTFPTKLLIELNTTSQQYFKIGLEELPVPRIPLSCIGKVFQEINDFNITEIFDRTTVFCILKIDQKYDQVTSNEGIHNPLNILSILPVHSILDHLNYRPWNYTLPDYEQFLYQEEQKKQYEEERREEKRIYENRFNDYDEDEWDSYDNEIRMNTDPDRWIDEEIVASEKAQEYIDNNSNSINGDENRDDHSKFINYLINQMVPLLISEDKLYCVYNKKHETELFEGQIIYNLFSSPFFPEESVWNCDITHPSGLHFQMIIFRSDAKIDIEKLFGIKSDYVLKHYNKYSIIIKRNPRELFCFIGDPPYIHFSGGDNFDF